MERYDAHKAARVWQRVRSAPEIQPPAGDVLPLAALIQGRLADTAVYRQLARQLPGSKLLHSLFQQALSQAACLKGMYTLSENRAAPTQAYEPKQENVGAALRRCYGRELYCLTQFRQLSSHREYGPVFSQLAQHCEVQCRMILETVGSMQK